MLPNSGLISLNDVRKELNIVDNAISLNHTAVRQLAERPNGQISMSDLYAKQAIKCDYIFEDRQDYLNKIENIAYQHNGDLSQLTFGFKNGFLYFGFPKYNTEIIKSTPKKIIGIGCEITSVNGLFRGLINLNVVSPELLSECKYIDTVYGLFFGCTSLRSVPRELLQNNPKIRNISRMFNDCKNLIEIDPEFFISCKDSLMECESTFYNCSQLQFIPELYNRSIYPNIQTQVGYAYGCQNASNYSTFPSIWISNK